ncbi:hypothetical protein FRC08_018257 [Ceratobasidium sp. 394]|nr:hypothetical protein FRC08_018257 [Ceratobasidium sp. 394]
MDALELSNKRWRSPESFEDTPNQAKRIKLHSENDDEILEMKRQAEEYESQGRWRQAAELKLRISQKTLGDNHPDTFKAMYLLANAFAQQGLLRIAATLQSQALSRQKTVLGNDHLDTVQGMHDLASTYLEQRRFQEAESLESQVLSIRRRLLGETSAETQWAMYQLAMIYHEQGRLEEARRLDKRVQKSGQRHLPPSIYTTLEQNKPEPSELDQLATVALARALCDLVPQESKFEASLSGSEGSQTDISGSSTDVIRRSENSCETLESMGYEYRISTKTPMEDVFKLLVNNCCSDLTDKIDLTQCPTAPYAGGRFGDVWCGVFEDQSRIAIKCLRLHTGSDASVKNVKRAARELYYWSKAKHKNVLELTGIAIFRGRLAMISPWMASGTLHTYIHKYLDANRWQLCEQVAEGLAYIHEIGMVHGDLKAVNVLVSDEGTAKLSDFGNSILSDHSLAFTDTTNVGGGTARWMAPELLREEDDDGDVANRSMPADVYALGMTILEVLTGQPPYAERKSDPWVTQAVVEGVLPQRPVQLASTSRFGDGRWAMLVECWRMQPNLRPTAKEVRDRMPALA